MSITTHNRLLYRALILQQDRMLDEQTVRNLALAFLQVEEHTHWQRPAFRVNNKLFATIWPLQQRVVIRLSPADQTQLIGQDSNHLLGC